MTPVEFPHSDIPGFAVVCTYPRLIAAYHVLHRLLVPRHPPSALSSLIYWILNFHCVVVKVQLKNRLGSFKAKQY